MLVWFDVNGVVYVMICLVDGWWYMMVVVLVDVCYGYLFDDDFIVLFDL